MGEKEAYPSRSFFKFLLDSSASKISIPPNFILRFGDKWVGTCELEANGRTYNVKCEKIDKLYYFTQGWLKFVEANCLKTGYFLLFQSNQETSSFCVSVYDSSQTCSFPTSDGVRVKVEPSLAPSSLGRATEIDSGNLSKPNIRSKIEDSDDDSDTGHEDSSSLSFSVTFKKYSWMAIPADFAKKTGIENHRQVMLTDVKGKKMWPVDLKPIKGGRMKLKNGWENFKRSFRVDPNVTCTFEFKKGSSNVLKVYVKRGKGRPYKQ